MSDPTVALRKLVEATAEHDASLVEPELAHLGKLGLFVRIRPIQVASQGPVALFIALFDASTDRERPGMGVTCVGMGSDTAGAAVDAVANWCLGVLPVLAHWRGGHSCLAGTASFEVPSRSGPLAFEVIKGPVVVRGESDSGEAAAPPPDGYLSLLANPLRAAKLKRGTHWLECFAIRMADGSVDATCRLDNRDWSAGQRLLADDARGWSGTTSSFVSRRQFLLLLPQGPEPEEPEPRSLWARLIGRG